MAISFANALGVHESALLLRTQRAQVIASNLANIDTPNYKARDIDFQAALKASMGEAVEGRVALSTTQSGHIARFPSTGSANELLYRTPTQPSIDGNTVEEHVEQAQYTENAMAFQAAFTLLNSRFKGLTSALRGE